MKAKIRQKILVIGILFFLMLVCVIGGFHFVPQLTVNAEEVKESSQVLELDTYYAKDDGKYQTSSKYLHNDYHKYFSISFGSLGEYTFEDNKYITTTGYPIYLSLIGNENYESIKESGTDGTHYISEDTATLFDYNVGQGLVIIEILNIKEKVVDRVIFQGLFVQDLSTTFDIPLKYHTEDYKLRVRLCFELWKEDSGKKVYWNVTELSKIYQVLANDIPYSKEHKPIGSYWTYDGGNTTTKALQSKTITVKGLNSSTTDNSLIRLELQSDIFKVNVNSQIYTWQSSLELYISGAYKIATYNLLESSYWEIDGKRTAWTVCQNGTLVVSVPNTNQKSISVKVRVNFQSIYTMKRHIIGINVENDKDVRTGYLEYCFNIPVSMSNLDNLFLYQDLDFQEESIIADNMILEGNTLAVISSSRINDYQAIIEMWKEDSWCLVDSESVSINKFDDKKNMLFTFNQIAPIQKYRIILSDNQGNERITVFYLVTDFQNLVYLNNLTNRQYNGIDNLPWVKDLSDHNLTTIYPELYSETIEKEPLENGCYKVIKKALISSGFGQEYIYTWEFYVGEVSAPRLNYLKYQLVYYHITESYSVSVNEKVYAFKNKVDAEHFAAMMIVGNYKQATSLSNAIIDKKKFDDEIVELVDYNSSREELLDRTNGDLSKIFGLSDFQAPVDEKISVRESDKFILSQTDTQRIYFKSGNNVVLYTIQDNEFLEIVLADVIKKIGKSNEISVIEEYYDGTSFAYEIFLQ